MAKRGRPCGSKSKPKGPAEDGLRIKKLDKGRYGFSLETPESLGFPGAVLAPSGTGRRKAQIALAERIAASGLTPLDYFLAILRDSRQSQIRRDWAAERSAPYCHSRLASVVHTGRGGGPIQTLDLSTISDEQLAALEAVFGKLVQSRGHTSDAAEGENKT